MERSGASWRAWSLRDESRQYNRPIMRAQRGFSLVEVMAALVVLAIVITTTLGMFVERRKHLRNANETILAYQALANEAEIWRRIGFGEIETKAQVPNFYSDTTILSPLKPYSTSFTVTKTKETVKNVRLTVSWGDAKARRSASLDVIRCDTGGPNLW